MLTEYMRLLDIYHTEINSFGWDQRLPVLTTQMERVWKKLSKEDRESALKYAHKLYQKRIQDKHLEKG
jgi:hypothetical protein